jgi:cytochrome c oxidase subunit 2
MAFIVVVEEQKDFDDWLAHQAADARSPSDRLARRGQDVFQSSGCGACHTVRGTDADGVIGPDLTHVGSRRTLGAATLTTDPDEFLRWIAHPEAVKPGVQMPEFHMLPRDDLRALAAYLDGLD